jgi:hypothetical protein
MAEQYPILKSKIIIEIQSTVEMIYTMSELYIYIYIYICMHMHMHIYPSLLFALQRLSSTLNFVVVLITSSMKVSPGSPS